MITIVMPTSPIPSHPSTELIDDSISKIRQYTDAKIIIMFDGVHESLEHRRYEYENYKTLVTSRIDNGHYGDCKRVVFEAHHHQAMMTRKTLDFVETPLIMFCEHDCAPIMEIPFTEICDLIATDNSINYMRFNIFQMILPEHLDLMIGVGEKNGIKFTRTIQWSQRPHIAKTDWYRKILENHFAPTHKTMIEDVMHSVVQVDYHTTGKDNFGLTIYTPEGNQLRSYHSDARGSDTKIIEA